MIGKLVVDIFSSHAQTLQDWRQQVPTGGNRVKNFENWLLVELVHRLRQAGANPVKTNGHMDGWRPSFWIKEKRFTRLQDWLRQQKVKGPKLDGGSIGPDVSVMLRSHQSPINIEIKTQLSRQELLVDALVVKWLTQLLFDRARTGG